VAFTDLVSSSGLVPSTSRSRAPETWGVLVVADLVAFAVAAATTSAPVAAVVCATAALVWLTLGLYARRFTLSLLDDVPALALGAVSGTAVTVMLGRATSTESLQAAAVVLAVALGARSLGYALIRRQRLERHEGFPAVILGSGPVAATLVDRVLAHPETGLRLVGMLDRLPPDTAQARPAAAVPFLGTTEDLERVVSEHLVRDVIVCDAALSSTELVEVLRTSSRLPVQVHVVPSVLQTHRLLPTTDQVWGVPLERLRRSTLHGVARWGKRTMDVAVAGVALVLLAPVLAAVALAVRRELGPGVIFRQQRVGLGGRHFELLKFRSMPHPTPGRERPWSVRHEVPLGPVGRFIRTYSLDEVPQLFNVLVGDMSLVGPRPERPVFVEQFSHEVSGYAHRHRVPVGVTGLAAVQGLRGDTSVRDRAYFDNWYIEHWSLWLDVKVLIRTVLAVVRGTGAR
jgi:exopolysaccharide biosynthesis polyprenyl glycosylphosphotransferase